MPHSDNVAKSEYLAIFQRLTPSNAKLDDGQR